MNRVRFLTTTMMTPTERAAGRFMRAPDHSAATGGEPSVNDSGDDENNRGGNSSDSNSQASGQNNSGQADDLAGFWDTPEDGDESDDSDDDSATASQALGVELKSAIDGFKPPELFTKEIGEAIANGDFEGVNQLFADSHRQTIQQSVMLTAKMVGAVVNRMQADFDRRIQSALGNQESNQFLEKEFPVAKNPQFRPVVEKVWGQALKHTKGDKAKAIRMTRGMLEAMGSEVMPNLRDAPNDPNSGVSSAASKSLVDELLSR